MTGRRAVVGLCMLCALAFTAIAAQSASAATKGTTAFTCVSNASKLDFATADCEKASPGTSFGHKEIEANLKTHIGGTNVGVANLKATVAGSEFQLTATGTEIVAGSIENVKQANGEHSVVGSGIVLKYTGVTESLFPCSVEGTKEGVATAGVIETYPLAATTVGQGDGIKLTPEGAKPFAEFDLFKPAAICPFDTGAPVFKVVGSIVVFPEGATLVSEHNAVTTQGNLRIGSAAGPKAGYGGTVTLKGGKEPKTEPTNPLSVTTVETP